MAGVLIMTRKELDETWGEGAFNFIQRLGVVIAALAALVTGSYYLFVQSPLNELSQRIEKLENQSKSTSDALGDQKQTILIIDERLKFMSEDLKFVKRKLERE
jgi:Tfp pilus assembly protein PilN